MKRPLRPRSVDPIEWFWAGFKRAESGCLEWQKSVDSHGYGQCSLDLGGPTRVRTTHRAAWILTNGPVPDGLSVLHHCDNRRCGDVAHLFLGTSAENTKDKVMKGRQTTGEKNGRAKLTEAQVLDIRRRLDSGESKRSIASHFGISPAMIYFIADGTNWSHVLP